MKFRPYSLPHQSRLHQEELVKAVHFYEQLKRENPPASGNQINGLTMSVKRPAN